MHNVWLRLTDTFVESDESGVDDGGNMAGDTSEGIEDDKETRTAGKRLEELRREAALAHQAVVQSTPKFTFRHLGVRSKLREAKVQLTKEIKKGDLDAIVRARVMAMIGVLNVYTNRTWTTPGQKHQKSWPWRRDVEQTTRGKSENGLLIS